MTIEDVLCEMRWCQQWPIAQGWANAIEAAMREPVARVVESGGSLIASHVISGTLPVGTKLYALPPDARSEIARLQKAAERLQKENERLRSVAAMALHEMRHTSAPRNSFTDVVDLLDAVLDDRQVIGNGDELRGVNRRSAC